MLVVKAIRYRKLLLKDVESRSGDCQNLLRKHSLKHAIIWRFLPSLAEYVDKLLLSIRFVLVQIDSLTICAEQWPEAEYFQGSLFCCERK